MITLLHGRDDARRRCCRANSGRTCPKYIIGSFSYRRRRWNTLFQVNAGAIEGRQYGTLISAAAPARGSRFRRLMLDATRVIVRVILLWDKDRCLDCPLRRHTASKEEQ
jgi:hypothetical protein